MKIRIITVGIFGAAMSAFLPFASAIAQEVQASDSGGALQERAFLRSLVSMKKTLGRTSVQVFKMFLLCLTVAYASFAGTLATAAANDETDVTIAENNEATSGASGEIDEIVVTATKRSQSINSVGMTITAATGDTLIERGITSTADLVRVTPGLNYTPSPYQEPVYVLRGVGLYESGLASSPAVTVYVDQIPLPSPVMTEVSPLDLERVEVLYGPQGTLFGQNSTGGAINYVTAKPTSSFQSGANVTYERFNKTSVDGFVSGPLTESVDARLAVGSASGGAWQYSQTRPGDQLGDTRVFQGRLLLDWHPSDRLKFEFGLSGFYDNSDTQAHQLVKAVPPFPALASPQLLAAPIAPNDPRAADWPAGIGLRSKDPFFQISARTDYDFTSDITLTALTSYQNVKQDKLSDLSGMDGPTGAESLGGPSFLARAVGSVEAFNQEIRLLGKQGPFIWTAGVYFDYMHIDDALLLTTNDTNEQPIPSIPAFEFPAGKTVTDVNDYAIFGNLDYQVNERFTAHVGLRGTDSIRHANTCAYDWNPSGDAAALSNLFTTLQEVFASVGAKTTPVVAIAPGGCISLTPPPDLSPSEVRNGLNEKSLSWHGGLDYKFDGGTLLYVSASRGYKSGIVSPTPASQTTQFTPAKQEKLDAFEVGFKAPFFDRRAHLDGSAFYYAYTDKQLRSRVLDPIFGLLEELVNIPRSRVLGLQSELTVAPVDGLNLSIAATYLDSKVTSPFFTYNQAGAYGNISGANLPLTPKVSVLADAQYERPVNGSIKAFAGISLTHHGSSNSTFDTAAVPAPDFELNAYTLLDLRAGIETAGGAWRLTFFGKNVTNKFYAVDTFMGVDTLYRDAGMPATYGVTLNARWH